MTEKPKIRKASKPKFSMDDANALIQLAETAPLQGMKQARQTDALLARFAQWYMLVSAKRAKKIKEPAA